jgi:hypothetical protein
MHSTTVQTRYRSAFYRTLQMVLLVSIIAGSLGHIASMLGDCWNPAELDYGEGIVLWQAQNILNPTLTYRDISTPPYNVTHYPPLYHLVTQAAQKLTQNWVAGGRIVSIASGIGSAFVIGGLLFAVLPRRMGRDDRWTAATFAGCSVFLHPFATDWMRTARVDFLGVFLSIVALALYIWRRKQGYWAMAAVTLFVMAVFSKHSLLTLPLSCLILEAFLNRRRTLVGLASATCLAAIPFAMMQYRTHGGFLLNLVSYNANPASLAQMKVFVSALFHAPWILFALAMPAVVTTALRLWRHRESSLVWWRKRCDESPLLRMLLLITTHISICVVLLPLAGSKRGSSTNYWLPLIVSLSPLTGVVVWRVLAAARSKRRSDFAVLCSYALLLLACQPMLSAAAQTLFRYRAGEPDQQLAQRQELIALVRNTPGIVYSEDMLLLLQAGKEVFAEPSIITLLAATGRWDEHPFLSLLAHKAFPLILVRDLSDRDRFSPEVARLISVKYERSTRLDGLWIYRPRP